MFFLLLLLFLLLSPPPFFYVNSLIHQAVERAVKLRILYMSVGLGVRLFLVKRTNDRTWDVIFPICTIIPVYILECWQ